MCTFSIRKTIELCFVDAYFGIEHFGPILMTQRINHLLNTKFSTSEWGFLKDINDKMDYAIQKKST